MAKPKEKKPILVSIIKDKDTVYESVKTGPRKLGWVIYKKGAEPSIQDHPLVQIEEDSYLPSTITPNIILPSGVGVDKSTEELFKEIKVLLGRAVKFENEEILDYVANYVLSTWTYDLHANVSYLAFSGLPGSGKTTALKAAAALVYKAVRGSGGDSDAVMMRYIHAVQGTLAIDEAQRSVSDPTSTFHRILAQGTEKDGCINKCVASGQGEEYQMGSFSVFGPKIFSGRSVPGEEAIISRTFEVMMTSCDINHGPSESVDEESWSSDALKLRNDLLKYRLKRLVGETGTACPAALQNLSRDGLTQRDFQVVKWLIAEAPNLTVAQTIIDLVKTQKLRVEDLKAAEADSQVLLATREELLRSSETASVYGKDVLLLLKEWGHKGLSPKFITKVWRENGLQMSKGSGGQRCCSPVAEVEAALRKKGIKSF